MSVDIDALVALGEGFTIEFKRSGGSSLGRELCAFANATGGTVLIGVADDGTICEVKNHNKLKSEVQTVARSFDPPLVVDVESVGQVLAVTVPAQQSKPYSFAGKFYLRQGATSQQLSRSEIRQFFFKEGLIHFDEMVCERYDLEKHLSDPIFAEFAKVARIPEDSDPLNVLENLHLLANGSMTMPGPGY
jgi:ATP-dependent DNA helicase RecG